jgi:hypothetical protein
VWINGPYPASWFNDVTIFRSCLLTFLDEDERVEAENGYVGEEPMHIKCPNSFVNPEECKYMQSSLKRSRDNQQEKQRLQCASNHLPD